MAKNCKYCFLCSSYNAYYVKGYCTFNKIAYGECIKNHCIKNAYDSCENFNSKKQLNETAKQFDLKKLEKLSDKFNELIIILKENFEN